MPGTGYETASLCLCVWWDLLPKIGSFHWCFCCLCFGCKAEGRMVGRSPVVLLFSLHSGFTGKNCSSTNMMVGTHYFFLTVIVTFINLILSFAFSRSVIGHSIVHRVLLEYLTYADTSSQLVCTVHV